MLIESGKYSAWLLLGMPTWKRLVKAVVDKEGGNNCALAQKIATEHPGK